MLSKLRTGIIIKVLSPNHFIKAIAIINSENVLPLPCTDSTLLRFLLTYFEHCIGCMTQAQTDYSHNECQRTIRYRRIIVILFKRHRRE